MIITKLFYFSKVLPNIQATLNLLHLTLTFKESKPSKVEEEIVKNLVLSSHL